MTGRNFPTQPKPRSSRRIRVSPPRGAPLSLARKLALLVAVPLIAVVGFAALALATSVGQAVDSGRLADEVSLARTAGVLTRDLHRERLASLAMLQNPPTDDQRAEFRRLAG